MDFKDFNVTYLDGGTGREIESLQRRDFIYGVLESCLKSIAVEGNSPDFVATNYCYPRSWRLIKLMPGGDVSSYECYDGIISKDSLGLAILSVPFEGLDCQVELFKAKFHRRKLLEKWGKIREIGIGTFVSTRSVRNDDREYHR